MTLKQKLAKIKLIVTDIDGVLTDGKISITEDGSEIKSFNTKDGLAPDFATLGSIEVVMITGRKSTAAEKRAKELGFRLIYKSDLAGNFPDRLINEYNVQAEHILYIGDDFTDIAAMKIAALSVVPRDATAETKKVADIITKAEGGKGVLVEVVRMVMTASGKWETALKKLTKNPFVN